MNINQLPVFVNTNELDPLTASSLNMRFAGFLHKLAVRYQLHEASLVKDSRDILAAAGIRQNTLVDNVEELGPCDLTPFGI